MFVISWANHEENSDFGAFLGARERAVCLDDLADDDEMRRIVQSLEIPLVVAAD
jgi:hypothetical protein